MEENKIKTEEKASNVLDVHQKQLFAQIKSEYDKISIYKLREIAKKLGVKSSTTMNKSSLVKSAAEMRLKSMVYYPSKIKEVSQVTFQEMQELTDDYKNESIVLNAEHRKGILRVEDENASLCISGFENDPSEVIVPMLMVNDWKLQSGDEISGNVRMLQKSGRYGLFELFTINGVKASKFVRKTLLPATLPTEILCFDSPSSTLRAAAELVPFTMGQRRLIIGLGALNLHFLAKEISQKFSEKKFELINLFLDETPENLEESSNLTGSNLILSLENSSEADEAVNLAVSYAKQVAAYGRNIAVVINNADVLQEQTLRNVFGAGRMTENGSITVVMLSSTLELTQIINKISRSAGAINIFQYGFSEELLIDIARSHGDSERLLSLRQKEILKVCRSQIKDSVVDVKKFLSTLDILRTIY
jgi:hypothetical protein